MGFLHLATTDLLFRLGLPRISRIEGRIVRELAATRTIRPATPPAQSLLVLGNSLLDAGVQFDRLADGLRPEIDAQRLVVEDTSYLDWFYGQRRLFDHGTRPDVVVLMLAPRQLLNRSVRGAFFAYHLMRLRDLPAIAHETQLTNTQASGLAFGYGSAIYGLGPEVRKVLLGRILPDLPQLMAMLVHRGPPAQERGDPMTLATQRLRALREEVAARGARLVLVVPALLGEDGLPAADLVRAGQGAGVPVLLPLPPGTLPASAFSDGYHLNETGADAFTEALVPAIRDALAAPGKL